MNFLVLICVTFEAGSKQVHRRQDGDVDLDLHRLGSHCRSDRRLTDFCQGRRRRITDGDLRAARRCLNR